ncbi:MAG: hypothetical protein HQ541_22865 [Mariniphaga sp.]|nr:hypothetical protein [Mariniphaga sp.]
MKRILFIGIIAIIITACSGNRNIVKVVASEASETEADSLEYELITFDTRFENWYDLNDSPAMYRSKEYYESWNKQYVTAWNSKSTQHLFYESIIGYEPGVDYGFDLNHKLFYYFQYVEKVLKKPILSRGEPQHMLIYLP